MSITRLQQARQMYAQGQRVAKTLDGSRPGYRGSDMASVGTSTRAANTSQKDTSGADYGGGNQGRDAATSSGVDRSRVSDTQQYNHYEAMNQYNPMKEDMLPGDIPEGFIKPEDAVNLGLNLSPYEQQRVDFLNTPYKPVNLPPYVPGGMLINTVGNFLGGVGAKKNRQFFADNVAGKYGFGYDMNAYKDYMQRRMAGEIGAYGNENMGQNAINARAAGGDGTQGIMDINIDGNVGDADGDGDVDQDDFIFKYFDKTGETLQAGAGGVGDLMTSIRERISNLFS
jgi:hypothetical protein